VTSDTLVGEPASFGLKGIALAQDVLSGEVITPESLFKLGPYGVRWLASGAEE